MNYLSFIQAVLFIQFFFLFLFSSLQKVRFCLCFFLSTENDLAEVLADKILVFSHLFDLIFHLLYAFFCFIRLIKSICII